MKTIISVFLLLILTSCSTVVNDRHSHVTPSTLILSKDKYDGVQVKVRGWLQSGFEKDSLWDSKKAYIDGNFMRSCISLLVPVSMDLSPYNHKFVEVEGVFIERLPSNVAHLGGCNIPMLKLIKGNPPTPISISHGGADIDSRVTVTS